MIARLEPSVPIARRTSVALAPITLFGVPIHPVTMEQALDVVEGAIERRESLQIGVVNAAKLVTMQRDAMLREDVASSDLVIADGAAVVWASRLLGRPLPERVTGIDLMMGMLARGAKRGHRFYCLGATEEVSATVAARMAEQFPGAVLAGRHHGYFKAEEDAKLAEDIARAQPDVLLVAMSSPRKEKFIARWGATMNVPVCHGVGGSFDVFAGKVQRAPVLWQKAGFEWLYRLLQEPRRMWRRYLVTNTQFTVLVVKALMRRAFGAG